MAREPVRVLGIDTSLRSTGLGVVASDGMRQQALAYEVVKNPRSWPHSKCLVHIRERVMAVIREHAPTVVAIEGVFYCKNVQVAFALGEARGAAMCASAELGLPIFEYAPRSVKKGVVGTGNAQKQQVAHMVKAILGLPEEPPSDAADALAIALCHLQVSRLQLGDGKQV